MTGIDRVLVKYLLWPSMAHFVAFSLFLVTASGMKRPFFSGMRPHLFARVKNFTKKFLDRSVASKDESTGGELIVDDAVTPID